MTWDTLGGITGQPPETWANKHDAGCTYGGFSCGYWMIADGCTEEHWERHLVSSDNTCPCGTIYPGAGRSEVIFDATDGEA
jgi:hypothetical protein